jgi:hypothetical protein
MRTVSLFVAPWLLAAGMAGLASPVAAQVVVGGHIGITVGSPPPVAQPYPPPPHRYPAPVYEGRGYPMPWAYRTGYDDGNREGVKDGRRGRRYDPFEEKDYRRASRGYRGEYGPKPAFQHHYRLGFREGYERGYQEASYGHPGYGRYPSYGRYPDYWKGKGRRW